MDNINFASLVTQAAVSPTAILEMSDTNFENTYLGYAGTNVSSLSDEKFAVCRVQKIKASGITTFMWANGTIERILPFENPDLLNYSFLR